MSYSGLRLGIAAVLAAWLLAASGQAPAQQISRDGQWEFLIVQPGMTLTAIMRDRYAGYRQEWPQIIDRIVEANPHAFVNGAPASLKRGSRIRIPRQVVAAQRRRPAPVAAQSSPDPTRARVPVSPPAATGAGVATTLAPAVRAAPAAPAPAPAAAVRPAATVAPSPAAVVLPAPLASEPATGAARLPPPVDQTLAQSDAGAPAAEDTEERGSERPPWWWIVSALLVISFLF